MKIDLNLKEAPNDVTLWRLYPGERRNHLDTYVRTNTVYLDMPGLELSPRQVWSKSQILPKIARSRARQNWHLAEPDDRPMYPSSNLEDYDTTQDSRSLQYSYNVLSKILKTAKIGDIVIVPEGNGWYSRVAIAEIVEDFDENKLIQLATYGDSKLQARTVRWLRTDLTWRNFSPQAMRELGGRRAFEKISSDITLEILRLSYVNFVYRDHFQYQFSGSEYDDDGYTLRYGTDLIYFSIAATNAMLAGEMAAFDGETVKSFLENSELRRRGISNFEIDFASPGHYRFTTRNIILGMTTVAIIAALGYAAAKGVDVDIDTLKAAEVINSQGSDPAEIEEKYRDILDSLKPKAIRNVVDLRQEADNAVGLSHEAKTED